VLCAKGYPADVAKGSHINGLSQDFGKDVEVFHAGTAIDGEFIVANGGRVLNVTALGATPNEAQQKAYAAVDKIDWPEGFCRRDIGWRAV
jgi:phosphoribosylamine---glycine ligase